jgi:nucleotide-binding universal stress UspA family protein
MKTFMTIFAVLPGAAAIPAVTGAHQALFSSGPGKLIGLMVTPVVVSNAVPSEVILPSFIEAQLAANQRGLREAEAEFLRSCKEAGIAGEWRTTQIASIDVSGRAGVLARAADLIIAPALPVEQAIGRHDLDQLVFESGRPVLALPIGWASASLGKRVVIAWNGKREAARAVFDSLPVLTGAEAVRVVSVRESSHDELGQFTPGDEIASTLARHGVPVDTIAVHCEKESVAEEIQAQAAEYGADLLVMGCYGHSRFREMILGGVTRDMLRGFSLPLFLSS